MKILKTTMLSRRLANIIAIASLALAGAAQMADATVFTWNGTNNVSATTNWNDNANWIPNTGNPGSTDSVIITTNGAVAAQTTINNVVTANTTVTSLTYADTNATGSLLWNVTLIPASV